MNIKFEQYRNKIVLVTGATGFTGRVLTRKLAQAGAKLRVIARDSSNPGDLSDLEIEWFRGEVFDPELVARATEGVHFIFHVAAAFRETHATEEGYRKVHLYSTQLLAKAVVDREDFERFLHVSTVGVHGHIEEGLADENYRFAPGDPYQRTKLEAEQWILQYAGETGLPCTVVRPGPIFGPGDLRLLKMFKMIRKGFFLMLGNGAGWYHLVHVEDLTNVMLLSAIHPDAKSEVFIAAQDHPVKMVDMAKMIADSMGNKVKIIRLPLWPFYLASDICGAICYPLGISPPIYRRRVDFYTKDRRFDNSKVRNVLGYEFRYDNASGLQETADWYKDNNLLG